MISFSHSRKESFRDELNDKSACVVKLRTLIIILYTKLTDRHQIICHKYIIMKELSLVLIFILIFIFITLVFVVGAIIYGSKTSNTKHFKNVVYLMVIFILIISGMLIASLYEDKKSMCQVISNSYNVHPADISNISNNDSIMFRWYDLGCATIPDKMSCKEIQLAYNIQQKEELGKKYIDYGWGTFIRGVRDVWNNKCSDYFTGLS